jgi:pSer/pThr/pTyr-binding forkhead associated (FHA) protein
MIAKLLVISGPDQGKSFEIVPRVPTVLGSSGGADVKLNDKRVSPFHCRLEERHQELFAIDLDSQCGIEVNNRFVMEDVLKPGDTLTLGDTILLVQDPDAIEEKGQVRVASAKSPKPAAAAPAVPATPAKAAPPKAKPAAPPPVKAATPAPPRPTVPEPEPAAKGELPERPEKLPGHILATYKVGSLIARGRTGFVFKANSIRDGREVALKVFTAPFSADEKNKATFTAAMKLAMPLRHPNIVPVLGAGKTSPYLWMAMESVKGESLTATIRKVGVARSLDWRRALRMAIHMARGINYLHEQGVVYRSVGPQNILCEGEGYIPRLSDFMRIRRAFDPIEAGSGAEEIPEGLLLYVAPEQTREESEIDSRSDIFSLGALLYQLLTGRPPFEGGSLAETITKIRREDPEDPRKRQLAVPQRFAGVVLQMLPKAAENRYQTMAEVIRELDLALKYEGMTL